MDILINRFNLTPFSVVSNCIVNREECGYCIEDTVREELVEGDWTWNVANKIPGETAVPSGTYKVIISFSKRFQKELPLLLDVPNFKGIRIHPGNEPKNTEGCILPGTKWRKKNPDWVSHSKKAFNPLFDKIKAALDDGEDVYIRINNNFLADGVVNWKQDVDD